MIVLAVVIFFSFFSSETRKYRRRGAYSQRSPRTLKTLDTSLAGPLMGEKIFLHFLNSWDPGVGRKMIYSSDFLGSIGLYFDLSYEHMISSTSGWIGLHSKIISCLSFFKDLLRPSEVLRRCGIILPPGIPEAHVGWLSGLHIEHMCMLSGI